MRLGYSYNHFKLYETTQSSDEGLRESKLKPLFNRLVENSFPVQYLVESHKDDISDRIGDSLKDGE